MNKPMTLEAFFYRTDAGAEPVREWLKELPAVDRRTIGFEITTVQYGWPIGMPLVRKMAPNLWEVRITLQNRIARILFTVKGNRMVLLHGFIKKSQATPKEDLELAMKRMKSGAE